MISRLKLALLLLIVLTCSWRIYFEARDVQRVSIKSRHPKKYGSVEIGSQPKKYGSAVNVSNRKASVASSADVVTVKAPDNSSVLLKENRQLKKVPTKVAVQPRKYDSAVNVFCRNASVNVSSSADVTVKVVDNVDSGDDDPDDSVSTTTTRFSFGSTG